MDIKSPEHNYCIARKAQVCSVQKKQISVTSLRPCLPCDVNSLSDQAFLLIAHFKRVRKAVLGPGSVSSTQVVFSPARYVTCVAW